MLRGSPGFLSVLQQQLESLPLETLSRVSRYGGLEIRDLLGLLISPRDYTVSNPEEIDASCVVSHDSLDQHDVSVGKKHVLSGKVAYCIFAGGAGTRIGSSKALLRLNSLNTTLLGHKLSTSEHIPHVWIMTSPSNHEEIVKYVSSYPRHADRVKIFPQYESFRLTPDNQLYMSDDQPSLHPCGHGDLIPCIQNNGMLDEFVKSGGEHIVVANVDNALFTVDDAIVGRHINSSSPVTCEVTLRRPSESGGVLCRSQGVDQIVELFRIEGELNQFQWINTNSMVFSANLDFSTVDWAWHRVKKNLNNHIVVQYERLIQDLTAAFKTQFVSVSRDRRFFPIKSADDLSCADRMLSA